MLLAVPRCTYQPQVVSRNDLWCDGSGARARLRNGSTDNGSRRSARTPARERHRGEDGRNRGATDEVIVWHRPNRLPAARWRKVWQQLLELGALLNASRRAADMA